MIQSGFDNLITKFNSLNVEIQNNNITIKEMKNDVSVIKSDVGMILKDNVLQNCTKLDNLESKIDELLSKK